MKRFAVILVPLLLVSGILAAAFHFSAGGGAAGRAATEDRIRRMLRDRASEAEAAVEISEYLAEFGSAADVRWFAVWAYLETSHTGSAARAVWVSGLRADPDTAPRFARMYLECRMRRSLSKSRGDLPAIVALADAGDMESRNAILSLAAEGDVGMAIETAFLLSRAASPMLPAVQDALRARGSREGRIAAALIGISPAHPEDLSLVRDLLEKKGVIADSAAFLRAAIVLGVSGDPQGLDFLHAQRQAADKDPSQEAQRSSWISGLAAGGDPEALSRLGEVLASTRIAAADTASYLDALIERLRRSDVAAGVVATAVWRTSKAAGVRRRLAEALLLEGLTPPPGLDRGTLLSELDASRDPVLAVLSSAARLGAGSEDAIERLMGVFSPPGMGREPASGSDSSEAYLLAAIALSGLGRPGR